MTNKNIYGQFVEYLKKEEQKLNLNDKNLEKHHILPLHVGGKKDGLIVLCTQKNHTLAHYYRYLSYKEKGDFIAFTMRWNQKIGTKERSLLAVEKNKKLKNLFWDSEWQSDQGKKGGIKGGIKNTKKQRQARQNVGLVYGKRVGLNNASQNLKKCLSKTTIWIYSLKNEPSKQITISPQNSFSDLIDILSIYSNQKISKSSFHKVIHGERRQLYGWSLFFIFL